jgi:hypothetical protein
MAVIVDAVDGMFWAWPSSHVDEEIIEREPARANLNATATVVFKVLIVRPVTPATHIIPAKVFWCFFTECGISMPQRSMIVF